MTEVQVGGFSPRATKFFAGLERDNSKDYWTANKTLFDEEVREPMAALVDSLPERFQPFKTFRMNIRAPGRARADDSVRCVHDGA